MRMSTSFEGGGRTVLSDRGGSAEDERGLAHELRLPTFLPWRREIDGVGFWVVSPDAGSDGSDS